MRIVTLDQNSLDECCRKLSQQILDSGYKPNLLIGVKNGGTVIAEKIFSNLSLPDCHLDFCHPVRSISKQKKSFFKNNLRILPTFVLNWMRILEYKFIFSGKGRKQFVKIELSEKISEYNDILLVDDAVDSGASLNELIRHIKTINPEAIVRSAVLTVTSNNPVHNPDYFIFKEKTLLRFPWSADAK